MANRNKIIRLEPQEKKTVRSAINQHFGEQASIADGTAVAMLLEDAVEEE